MAHYTRPDNYVRFPLSSDCYVMIRSGNSWGGNVYRPRVTIHKDVLVKSSKKNGEENFVSRHYAVHFTRDEYAHFLLALQAMNNTIQYLDNCCMMMVDEKGQSKEYVHTEACPNSSADD